MRSHRVWNEINADNYANKKSFGGEYRQRVYVGSSATYSNHLADLEVREIDIQGTDWSMFILYLDGEQVRRSAFNNRTKQYIKCELDGRPITDWITDYEAAA